MRVTQHSDVRATLMTHVRLSCCDIVSKRVQVQHHFFHYGLRYSTIILVFKPSQRHRRRIWVEGGSSSHSHFLSSAAPYWWSPHFCIPLSDILFAHRGSLPYVGYAVCFSYLTQFQFCSLICAFSVTASVIVNFEKCATVHQTAPL